MTASKANMSAWALIASFALILGGVPVVQVAIEWRHGARIQAMDLLRNAPRAENLRRYERELEARSWAAATVRPAMRELWFALSDEPGPEALIGLDGWLFYRPGVRYLMRPDASRSSRAPLRAFTLSHLEEGRGLDLRRMDGLGELPGAGNGRGDPIEIISEFRDRLGERGIELLVVPVPGKASIYPDKLSDRYAGVASRLRSPTEDFIAELRGVGVEVVDLFDAFRRVRDRGTALYLEQDTHWTPAGAELAATMVGDRLATLGWIRAGTNRLGVRHARVLRRGDIVEMTRLAGLERRFEGQLVACRQVVDPVLGLLVPAVDDRPGTYRQPLGGSRVLVLGDSYCRIYQYAEPRSLGEVIEPAEGGEFGDAEASMGRRLLPGSAGFVGHLTRVLADRVDAVVSDGGAATEVRKQLSVNPEILEGKAVVVWAFAERDLGLSEWEAVPLPPRLDGGE